MANKQEPVEGDAPPWLRWLVYIMGIALLLSFFVLMGAIIYKSGNLGPAVVSGQTQSLTVGLPLDEKFSNATLSGDRLTVTAGRRVYVIDVPSHQVILRVDGVQD